MPVDSDALVAKATAKARDANLGPQVRLFDAVATRLYRV
jgi:hypothetical protein